MAVTVTDANRVFNPIAWANFKDAGSDVPEEEQEGAVVMLEAVVDSSTGGAVDAGVLGLSEIYGCASNLTGITYTSSAITLPGTDGTYGIIVWGVGGRETTNI